MDSKNPNNANNIKYKMIFKKVDRLKFIGHLDLLNVVQRIFKRSGLPIAYSRGFNPHQIMSFALPLTLGMEGLGEILDFELSTSVDEIEIKKALNKSAVDGFEVLEVRKIFEGEKNSAAVLTASTYTVYFPQELLGSEIDIKKLSEEFMEKKSVIVEKKAKRGFVEVEIRPHVYSLKATSDSISMTIAQGSKDNLKPQLLVSAILTEKNLIDFNKLKCTRNVLLKTNINSDKKTEDFINIY